MTENKRFTLDEDRIQDNQSPCCYIEYYKGLIPIVDLLNELAEENQRLKNDCSILVQSNQDYRKENEQLKSELAEQGIQIDFLKDENTHMRNVLEENKQLQQRNDRQAKQLDRLYRLIEEKDWRTLNDILDDFKRCEEQLQKEWGAYGDFE